MTGGGPCPLTRAPAPHPRNHGRRNPGSRAVPPVTNNRGPGPTHFLHGGRERPLPRAKRHSSIASLRPYPRGRTSTCHRGWISRPPVERRSGPGNPQPGFHPTRAWAADIMAAAHTRRSVPARRYSVAILLSQALLRSAGHGELALQAADRAVADVHVDGAGFDDELSRGVGVEADVARPQGERDCLGLAWRQRDPLESVKPANGLQDGCPVLVNVELDDVVPRHGSGVGEVRADGQRAGPGDAAGRQVQV